MRLGRGLGLGLRGLGLCWRLRLRRDDCVLADVVGVLCLRLRSLLPNLRLLLSSLRLRNLRLLLSSFWLRDLRLLLSSPRLCNLGLLSSFRLAGLLPGFGLRGLLAGFGLDGLLSGLGLLWGLLAGLWLGGLGLLLAGFWLLDLGLLGGLLLGLEVGQLLLDFLEALVLEHRRLQLELCGAEDLLGEGVQLSRVLLGLLRSKGPGDGSSSRARCITAHSTLGAEDGG